MLVANTFVGGIHIFIFLFSFLFEQLVIIGPRAFMIYFEYITLVISVTKGIPIVIARIVDVLSLE